MKRAATQPRGRARRVSAFACGARALSCFSLGALPCVAAVLATCLLTPVLAAASPARQYLLKHPKREHCRAHYVKRNKTVKVKQHGHTRTVRRTFCVHGSHMSPGVPLIPVLKPPPAPKKPAAAQPGGETPQEMTSRAYVREFVPAYRAGLQAFVYSAPLLDMQAKFQSNTSVTVANHKGYAPVNQFSHVETIAGSGPGALAPDTETLYSQAWLELGKEGPIVVHVPATPGGFSVVPLYSPYEENFANIGEGASGLLPPGDYVIAGPGQLTGQQETEGMQIIHSPYSRVWVLPRTLVASEQDLKAAIAIQAEMKLVPLSRWAAEGLSYEPPAPEVETRLPTAYHAPGTQANEDPLFFWTAVGAALKQFPPPAADAEELAALAEYGIGPAMSPAGDPNLGLGALDGLREAVREGRKEVSRLFNERLLAGFEAHNGWGLEAAGEYGTDYDLRAITNQFGLGALDPNVALYLFTESDRTGTEFNGASTRYVVHFPAGDFPVPVAGFWSLTVYSPNGFLVSNPLGRHTLGGGSELHYEPDGSLNLYLQSDEPSTAVGRENWLPSTTGSFHLVMRMYGLDESAIEPLLEGASSAWTPPTILPCLENGQTAEGWSCAQ